MQVRLTTPLTRQELAPLHAGDTVLLTGTVYTARDAAHARMNEALDRGEPLPFDIKGAAIYYVGPTPERPGCAIGAAGPTTSGRMDKFTPRLLDLGLACMIGKGKRDEAVKAAVVRNGAVYLAAIGGAGALMAGSVKSCEIIAWPDLGCEAVRRLEVVDMPLTVLLDAHGGALYQSGPQAYLQSLTLIRNLRKHRTIPALRHRSWQLRHGICVAKMSIISGCGTPHRASGAKAPALCDRAAPASVRCFRHWRAHLASSIICAFGLASAAPRSPYRHLELCGIALI